MKELSYSREADMMGRMELLEREIDRFREEYGVTVHVKNFSGYMASHPVLGGFVERNLYHSDEFCSYIKESHEANEKCVVTSNDMLSLRLDRMETQRGGCPRGFFGVCWCGVCEYVYPIRHNGMVVGALLAGSFRADRRRLDHCFSRLTNYGFKTSELEEKYAISTRDKPLDIEAFEQAMSMLGEYVSMVVEYCLDYSLVTAYYNTTSGRTYRRRITYLAIEYISKNLNKKITVSDMSNYCLCSKSTLNHMFGGAVGMTIPEFVAHQRVNRSKYLLMNKRLSIEEIGYRCGFSSPGYFSVVFRKQTGMSPMEYRSRYIGRTDEDVSSII